MITVSPYPWGETHFFAANSFTFTRRNFEGYRGICRFGISACADPTLNRLRRHCVVHCVWMLRLTRLTPRRPPALTVSRACERGLAKFTKSKGESNAKTSKKVSEGRDPYGLFKQAILSEPDPDRVGETRAMPTNEFGPKEVARLHITEARAQRIGLQLPDPSHTSAPPAPTVPPGERTPDEAHPYAGEGAPPQPKVLPRGPKPCTAQLPHIFPVAPPPPPRHQLWAFLPTDTGSTSTRVPFPPINPHPPAPSTRRRLRRCQRHCRRRRAG